MASRTDLQSLLESILGSEEVYYQAPPSLSMTYPAILYSIKNYYMILADDAKYLKRRCYEIIVISRSPEFVANESILELPYCSFDRQYKADNLYHTVFTLYY
jgi:hypothetical protein